NVSLEPRLFADQRASTLEDQIATVVSSRAEMGSSVDSAAARVGMQPRALRVALAAYLRSLTSFDTRFDRAVRGDTLAMPSAERHGFTVFMGKARCATCHFPPLFSGVMPPDFIRSELEIIGAPSAAGSSTIDSDSGRARVDGLGVHVHAFKV